jgi:DNA-binding response OmpR family regulator
VSGECESGAVDYMTNPFDPTALARRVKRILAAA